MAFEHYRGARTLTLSATFAALTAVGALLSIPFYPVPLSLQTFFVYLSVLVMGRYAFLSQLIYLMVGLAGLPVFARGMSGYAVLLGPTGGFVLGFVAGAFVSGRILSMARSRRYAGVLSIALCMAIIFGMGWISLAYWLGWDFTAAGAVGVLPFVPGDILKGASALAIGSRVSAQLRGSWARE